MNVAMEEAGAVMTRAKQARQASRAREATTMLEQLVASHPAFGPAWNLLGVLQLEGGKPSEAVHSLSLAVQVDPDPPFGWFNLAKAQRAVADTTGELQARGRPTDWMIPVN